MSPTSSRNSVPPSARSNLPRRCLVAPVKAPASCPKSSLSMSSAGTAAQFSFSSGRLGARRGAMDRARDQLLAGAALAGDEHAGVERAARSTCSRSSAIGAAFADQLVEWPASRAAPGFVFGAHQAQRVLEHDEQPVGGERLFEEVERAESRRAHGGVDRRVPAHHDDLHVVPARAQLRRAASGRRRRAAPRRAARRRRSSWRAALGQPRRRPRRPRRNPRG